MRCEAEWKEVVPRMGRWIDFEGGYKTMDTTYMESVWWCALMPISTPFDWCFDWCFD